jgi:F-type H+-transporting ATPase subunit b
MRGSFHRSAIAGCAFALLVLSSGTSRAAEVVGLPQLDVHTYTSQLFWLAVFFVIVYAFMRYVGIPRVAAIVEERKAQVDRDLSTAESLRVQAAEARKAYEAAMAEAHTKARQLLAETQERNKVILAEHTKEATANADRHISQAVKRIEAASHEAFKSLPDMAANLAAEITAKLTGQTPQKDVVTHAVTEAVGRGGL